VRPRHHLKRGLGFMWEVVGWMGGFWEEGIEVRPGWTALTTSWLATTGDVREVFFSTSPAACVQESAP